MYCTECGKQIRDGARFCNYCGTAQSPAAGADGENEPVRAAAPRYEAAPADRGSFRYEAAPVRREAPAPKRKKSKAKIILALVMVLALLGGGGWLLYQKVIFPRNVLKDADRLVENLAASPLGDKPEDFGVRIKRYDHDYSEIARNKEARLKVKDHVRGLYLKGDYAAWIHALYMLQGNDLFYSQDEAELLIERSDLDELHNSGWPVNFNGGWYSSYNNQDAVYQKYPGFYDRDKFEIYVWGDFFAAKSAEYGWRLFYRGWELREIEPARWSTTSAEHMQYVLQNARTYGDLMILPYDDDIFYDAYLVINAANGDFFMVWYD